MAQDPCDVVQEEEEVEEASPEEQDLSEGLIVGNVLSGPTLPPLPPVLRIPPGLRDALLSDAAVAEFGAINALRTGEILRSENANDISLTPILANVTGVGKSTWLINNSSLIDFGQDPISAPNRFVSKPGHVLAVNYQRPTDRFRYPVNVVFPNYDYDSLRWMGDKMWINISHLDGPGSYRNIEVAKEAQGKASDSSDFYFLNPCGFFGYWSVLYLDSRKWAAIKEASRQTRDISTNAWRNYPAIVAALNNGNFLNLNISSEVHEIHAAKNFEEEDWSWTDYFSGNIEKRNIIALLATAQEQEDALSQLSSQELNVRFRESSLQLGTVNDFRLVHVNAAGRRVLGSNVNPYPVIPFYGPRFREESNLSVFNPAGSGRLETVGEMIFEDYVTSVPDLLTKEEAEVADIGTQPYFDIKPIYSYYDCLYERVFSRQLTELELPSPYLKQPLMAFDTSSTRESGTSEVSSEDYEDLMMARLEAADGFLNLGFLASRVPNIQQTVSELAEDFVSVADASTSVEPDSERALLLEMEDYYGFNIGNTQTNIFLSSYTQEELEDVYSRRYLNPMFVDMEFGVLDKSQLAEALTFNEDDKLVKSLFSSLGRNFFDREPGVLIAALEPAAGTTYVDTVVSTGIEYEDENSTGDGITYSVSDNFEIEAPRSIDFSSWFQQAYEYYTGEYSSNMTPVEKFANIFKMLLIKSRVARFINSRKRTYKEILSGVPAKSEVLGYTIDKFKISRNDETIEYVSSFHLLSNTEGTIDRFVDSQVDYGSIYEYRVNRIVAVVGDRYAYSDIVAQDFDDLHSPDRFKKAFGVISVPNLKIMSLPSTTKRVAITDMPPLFPNVDFVPFKNVSDKVLINLSANTGEYRASPVIMEDDDVFQFFTVALHQGLPSAQAVSAMEDIQDFFGFDANRELATAELIRFRSDDPASTFEVFRIEDHPVSYDDFRGNKILKRKTRSDNFSLVDDLKPNKKYYYLFRTEDIHGHVSNPSPIYEVELVSVNDAARLVVKVVELIGVEQARRDREVQLKSMRHMLAIKPTITQRKFNAPSSGKFSDIDSSDTSVLFGEEGIDKVWNKRFKIRIRSKKTGKELDVNLRFNAKVNINEENKKVNLIC